ncbi:MAG: hypothetical protein MUE40_11980 [Anaerolineae bacterium]|nr:hypothetical protein [Anaerolineae bacterium]
MSDAIQYPDVLGTLTQGKRAVSGAVHLASALRPRIVRAGRPFEMLMLVQNTTDLDLEVVATLRLPEKDARGQRGRFITKADKLAFRLEPAEVGLVILPLTSLPDTAASADYKIGMDLRAGTVRRDKPNRIRSPQGGDPFDFSHLSDERRALLTELQSLPWHASASGTLLESPLTVMSGTVGAFADLRPSWTSLWTLRDHSDQRIFVRRFAGLMKEKLLPRFTLREVLPVLEDYTATRFQKLRYQPTEAERRLIARLLTRLFTLAGLDAKKAALLSQGADLNVSRYLTDDFFQSEQATVHLPDWFEKLLELVEKDERLAEHPVRAVAHFLYDDLLRAAMLYAFMTIEEALGIEIGSLEERLAYTDQVLAKIEANALDFDALYMPLVLGGALVIDQTAQRGEKPSDFIDSLRKMLAARAKEKTDDNENTFELARQVTLHLENKFVSDQW